MFFFFFKNMMQGYMYMSIFVEKWNTLEKEIIIHQKKKVPASTVKI